MANKDERVMLGCVNVVFAFFVSVLLRLVGSGGVIFAEKLARQRWKKDTTASQ